MAWTKERFEKEVGALNGAECLYRERPIFAHVRVVEATARDNHLILVFDVLPSPGFSAFPGKTRMGITAHWEGVSEDLETIAAPYAGFYIYLNEKQVREIVTHAATLAPLVEPPLDQKTAMERYFQIARFLDWGADSYKLVDGKPQYVLPPALARLVARSERQQKRIAGRARRGQGAGKKPPVG